MSTEPCSLAREEVLAAVPTRGEGGGGEGEEGVWNTKKRWYGGGEGELTELINELALRDKA